jgi:phosphoglycolate phosphatase
MIKASGPISLVITDLDNTLYDWMSSFVPALYSMVESASVILRVTQERLLDDLKAVHQDHHNSEHPFALLETKVARDRLGHLERKDQIRTLDPAFYAFNRTRKQLLKLYDGVSETLLYLRNHGVPVVAHTDAPIPNSLFRLERLGIEGMLERLYAPRPLLEDSETTHKRAGRSHDFLRILPPEDRKPNPSVLSDISADYSVAPCSVLYVGDSIVRDIYMAKRAGAHAAWAKYGTRYDRNLWQLLVRVTHWREQDVREDERLRREAGDVIPDIELDSFADILKYFEFAPLRPIPRCR